MLKRIFIFIQQILPQHGLSRLAGRIAGIRLPWLKNFFIKQFIAIYHVNMLDAVVSEPAAYATFNDFFTRQLKPQLRPIAQGQAEIASPVDGTVVELGQINQNQLLQAKHFYFNLETLLGEDKVIAQQFYNGMFATFYLAPYNYHRVHMPITGRLQKAIYIPGKLFSVNRITTDYIPNLYSRNERLICIFATSIGPMVVILVGAMIVGSIQTVWMQRPIRAKYMIEQSFAKEIELVKGAELGLFKMGSTVILLYGKNKVTWQENISANSLIKLGQVLANISANN